MRGLSYAPAISRQWGELLRTRLQQLGLTLGPGPAIILPPFIIRTENRSCGDRHSTTRIPDASTSHLWVIDKLPVRAECRRCTATQRWPLGQPSGSRLYSQTAFPKCARPFQSFPAKFRPVVSKKDPRCGSAPEHIFCHFPRGEEFMKAQVSLNHLKDVGVFRRAFITISFCTPPFWKPHGEELTWIWQERLSPALRVGKLSCLVLTDLAINTV